MTPHRSVVLVAKNLRGGGLERLVFQLAQALGRYGFQSSVICTEGLGAYAKELRRQGIEVSLAKNPRAFRQRIEGKKVGCCHVHFVQTWVFEVLHQLSIPIVETLHNTYVWYSDEDWAEESRRVRWVKRCIAVSPLVQKYYLNHIDEGVSPRIQTIENGTEPSVAKQARGRVRRKFGVRDTDFFFVHLGRYGIQKNLVGTLKAFDVFADENPHAVLLCAGGGMYTPYGRALKKQWREMRHRNRVRLCGSQNDTNSLLFAADAFVMNSYFEGWSLAATEALMQGLPLLHTRCGSADVLVGESFERGIVVENAAGDALRMRWADIEASSASAVQSNQGAWVDAMREVCSSADVWQQSKGERLQYAQENFTLERMLARYSEVFASVT